MLYFIYQQTEEIAMNEWTDGSLINNDAIDNMDEATLDMVLAILSKVK